MCFPVPIMSEYKVGIKYILNEQREKRELLFSTFPSKKKKIDGQLLWPSQPHEFPFIQKVYFLSNAFL